MVTDPDRLPNPDGRSVVASESKATASVMKVGIAVLAVIGGLAVLGVIGMAVMCFGMTGRIGW